MFSNLINERKLREINRIVGELRMNNGGNEGQLSPQATGATLLGLSSSLKDAIMSIDLDVADKEVRRALLSVLAALNAKLKATTTAVELLEEATSYVASEAVKIYRNLDEAMIYLDGSSKVQP